MRPILLGQPGSARAAQRLLTLLKQQGNSPATRAQVAKIEALIQSTIGRVGSVPQARDADLNKARDDFAVILRVQLQAYQDYDRAFRANLARGILLSHDKQSLAQLDAGDRLLNRSRMLFARWQAFMRKLDAKYRF